MEAYSYVTWKLIGLLTTEYVTWFMLPKITSHGSSRVQLFDWEVGMEPPETALLPYSAKLASNSK